MTPSEQTTDTVSVDESSHFQDILGDIGGEEHVEGSIPPSAATSPASPSAPPAVPPTTPPVTPSVTAAPPTVPVAVPAAPGAAPQAPPAALPSAPGQQVVVPPASAPGQQPSNDAEMQAVRTKALDEMTSSFALSKEDKEALMLTDEGAVAMQRLAAQATLRAYENVMASVMQLLPGFVRNVHGSQSANERIWNDFFTTNPQLKAHEQQVYQIATDYRKMFPQTPPDQLMKEIAALCGVRLNLAPVPAEVKVQPTQVAPPAPRPAGPPRPPMAPAGVTASVSNGGGDPRPEYIDEILHAHQYFEG